MTTGLALDGRPRPATRRRRQRGVRARKAVGGFYLFTGGVHLGIVAAGPEFYRHFADGALLDFVTSGWRDIFMAHPAGWGLLMAAGETALGLLLLRGGTSAKIGWAGVVAFHLALLVFGWGFWVWSVPALAFLILVAGRDWQDG